ncbi:hypothetical protein C1752_08465 [Acaryochloris thomasi RCC1774]|uniref:YtkA-like domain-containing protein n=1 Tax=Acaryochloris thomasi RCC1774 TaxID=1764569 RepID=A0A2W1J9V7_9CYAN|nr:FixH family protein [Acaryochloris thomasi]PZD71023.1 hypothetical protein C1752_08465 [Acaryochloris thomasi RCC1774]
MKKTFLAIAVVSTLLVACGANSNEQATQSSSNGSSAPIAQTEANAESNRDSQDHSERSGTNPVKASEDIHLVSPESGELPMGDAEIVVHIEQENLTPEDVSADVSMPMAGEADMTSLAIIEPGDEAKQFKIKTNFGMAGSWTMEVKAKDAEPATLAFNVK